MENIKINLSHSVKEEVFSKDLMAKAENIIEELRTEKYDFTGWVKLPCEYDREEVAKIKAAAEKIKAQSNLLIVIGVGGSYLGSRSVADALKNSGLDGVKLVYAGNNLSAAYHEEIIRKLWDNETSMCVISKSGTTPEMAMAFNLVKAALEEKYGEEEAAKRIYTVTDKEKGPLKEIADEKGYETFVIPDDIGGRYSVFTPVGLLPIAAAGVDVDEFMAGAEAVCNIFADKEAPQHEEYVKYPVSRLLLGQQGKAIEAFEYYEPCLRYFAEWLKQIFGESEGKDGKGIFPAAVRFSTELHSMGQFLQDGSPIFFETVLDVKKPPMDLVVPMQIGKDATATSMNLVNRAACEGTIAAHVAVGTPVGIVEIPELTPFYMGQVLYFFEMSCAVSGMLHEVNPFDQPGVEAYKKEMRAYLATLRGEN